MGSRRLAVVAAVVAVLALAYGANNSLRPFATVDREVVSSTPGLGPLDQRYTLTLRPRDEACVKPVVLTERSQKARFRLVKPGGPPVPPVVVTARGPGYSSSARIASYAAPGDQLPHFKLTPPQRELIGEVCIRNAGRQALDVVGTDEIRSHVPAEIVLNGEPIPGGKELELHLLEERERSFLDRTGVLVDNAHTLSSGYLPKFLVWVLLVLAAIGMPAAVIGGLFLSVRAADPPPPRP